MTLLSIFGASAIALPLSPPFPPNELQYIMDQSEASMLLSSEKFDKKAQEVFKTGLKASPKSVRVEKKMGGGDQSKVTLEGGSDIEGGMMLYTSGTTARPVRLLPNTLCCMPH